MAEDGDATLVVHKHLGGDSLQKWLTGIQGEFAKKVKYAAGLAPPATTTSATTTG